MIRSTLTSTLLMLVLVLGSSTPLHAFLGGFEQTQGYRDFDGGGGPDTYAGVQWYNAGMGVPASGTTTYATPSSPSTSQGVWVRFGDPSSYGIDASHPYPGGSTSYICGHSKGFDRTYTNSGGTLGSPSDQALEVTTEALGWGGPTLEYRYSLDSADLGVVPSTTSSHIINFSFWWCSRLAGTADGDGGLPEGYFGNSLEFADSAGNIGFTVGLTQRAPGDTVTYWNGSAMVESTITGPSKSYDRLEISINTDTDTASFSYVKWNTSTNSGTTTVLATNVPLQAAMGNFTGIRVRSSPGVQNDKLYSLDDFQFAVTPISVPCSMNGINVVAGACNNNGTPLNTTDDYYTASVTVTYANPPATGSLVLSGPALHPSNTVSSVAVGSLGSPTSHTFVGVRLNANGTAQNLTASFQ
ncbi:MAG: hypothetical protein KDK99_22460 [Verrucomicrobiales bacterium]|nr:hypothetical protein [Verrucomicrobiales bacterium]